MPRIATETLFGNSGRGMGRLPPWAALDKKIVRIIPKSILGDWTKRNEITTLGRWHRWSICTTSRFCRFSSTQCGAHLITPVLHAQQVAPGGVYG